MSATDKAKQLDITTQPKTVTELEEIDALFVQTAHGAETVDGRIILRNVTPSTIYFSDRPQRVVGHLVTSDFIGFWDEGDDSFKDDPPNAVLAFIGKAEEVPTEVVVEITDPKLDGANLSYAATVLEGSLPAKAEGCSLFIDPFGSRRRDRRHDRRDRRHDRRDDRRDRREDRRDDRRDRRDD
jgi:hypothetical protein